MFFFFMFRDVSECSGMFRHVPECSMFRILSTALIEHRFSVDQNVSVVPYNCARFGIAMKADRPD